MRVLFVTSNGAGLGHLTRGMAIARRLGRDATPLFLTMSQALPVVRSQGFYAEYLLSPGTAGSDRRRWNALLERRLREVVATYDPAVVMFDGTYPYLGLVAAIDGRRPFVWCRRAMWRPGLGAANLSWAPMFDAVLEPGEFAAERDAGATRAQRASAVAVDPIVLCDRSELVDRRTARSELGLAAGGTAALVSLGAGNINDTATAVGRCVAALRAVPGLQVAVVESTIAARPTALPAGVERIRRYPLAPYLRAFDFAVTAAGYNSYHEMVAYGVPSLFAPNTATAVDDQLARARHAEAMGVGRCWADPSPSALDASLAPLLDPSERAAMAGRAEALALPNGAGAAAAFLRRLANGAGP